MTIQKFTQLNTWKEAHLLVILTYWLTDKFPSKELFILVSQMRRCAVSITSNIAEGFTRQGKKEKIQFYFMAKASLTELENQIIISKDLKYISGGEFQKTIEKTELVGRLLTGLIKSVKSL